MMSKRALFLLLILTGCTRKSSVPPEMPIAIKELQGLEAADLRQISPNQTVFKLRGEADYTVNIFKGLDQDKAKAMIKQKSYLVQSLYNEEKSPYPGMTSNVVKCPERFLPVVQEKNDERQASLRLQLYANSRRVYGVCDPTSVHFKSVYLFVYCKHSRMAVQVEGFLEDKNALAWESWLVPGSCL